MGSILQVCFLNAVLGSLVLTSDEQRLAMEVENVVVKLVLSCCEALVTGTEVVVRLDQARYEVAAAIQIM